MSADADILQAARELFTALGQPALYRPTGGSDLRVSAIVRQDLRLDPSGAVSQVLARQTEIEMLIDDVGDVSLVRRGDTVIVDGIGHVVDRVTSDDGVVVRVLTTTGD